MPAAARGRRPVHSTAAAQSPAPPRLPVAGRSSRAVRVQTISAYNSSSRVEPLFEWDDADASTPFPVVDGSQEEEEEEDSVGLLRAGAGPEASVAGMRGSRGPGVCLRRRRRTGKGGAVWGVRAEPSAIEQRVSLGEFGACAAEFGWHIAICRTPAGRGTTMSRDRPRGGS